MLTIDGSKILCPLEVIALFRSGFIPVASRRSPPKGEVPDGTEETNMERAIETSAVGGKNARHPLNERDDILPKDEQRMWAALDLGPGGGSPRPLPVATKTRSLDSGAEIAASGFGTVGGPALFNAGFIFSHDDEQAREVTFVITCKHLPASEAKVLATRAMASDNSAAGHVATTVVVCPACRAVLSDTFAMVGLDVNDSLGQRTRILIGN